MVRLMLCALMVFLGGCGALDAGATSELRVDSSTLRNQALPHAAWVGKDDSLTAVGINGATASVEAGSIVISNSGSPVNLSVLEFTPADPKVPFRASTVVGLYGEIGELTMPNGLTMKSVRFGVGDALKDLGAAYQPWQPTIQALSEDKRLMSLAFFEMLKTVVPDVTKAAIQGVIDGIKGVETVKTNTAPKTSGAAK